MISILRSNWRLLGFGMLMTFWSAPGQTFFISLFGQEIRAALALSHSEFGGLYSAATLLSAAVILWSGKFVDSVTAPRLSCIVVAALAMSMLLLATVNHIAVLFVAFFLLRQLGQSLMMLISSTTMLRYLPEMRGKATALSSMGYIGAEAMLPIAVVMLSVILDWRQTLILLSVVLCVSIFTFIPILLRDFDSRHAAYIERHRIANDSGSSESLKDATKATFKVLPQRQWARAEVLRDPRFYLLIPALLAQSLIFTGFIFHQGFILESKGWSWQWWASLFSAYALIALISKLIVGALIDRLSALAILPFGLIPLGLGLAVLALGDSVYHAMGFFIGLGITTGVQTTLSGPVMVELYGDKNLGSIKSVFSSLIVFGTGITPFVMGIFIDRGIQIETLAWYSIIYIVFAIFLLGFAFRRKI